MPTTSHELTDFLISYQVPAAAYTWNHPEYNLYNILSLWQFVAVSKELLIDGCVAGGFTGAFRVALAVMVFLRLKDELLNGRMGSTGDVIRWGRTEDEQINSIIDTLSSQILDSLPQQELPDIYQGLQDDRWLPSSITYQCENSETPIVISWPCPPFGVGSVRWVPPSPEPENEACTEQESSQSKRPEPVSADHASKSP
jgi:hypothetical protein